MSDLFHEDVPDEYVVAVAQIMQVANWHTFQVLTKRSARMRDLLASKLNFAAGLEHIWWGVSVENRRHGLPRVRDLRNAQAAMRFLSIEPLLEDLGKVDLAGISWVIVGGESGPGARRMKEVWVKSLRDQCQGAGVPFFFKQWGGVRRTEAGRELDGCTYNQLPNRSQKPPLEAKERKRLILDLQESTRCQTLEFAASRLKPHEGYASNCLGRRTPHLGQACNS